MMTEMSRRKYRMHQRLQIDSFDFVFRFRLAKETFMVVLETFRSDLEYIEPR